MTAFSRFRPPDVKRQAGKVCRGRCDHPLRAQWGILPEPNPSLAGKVSKRRANGQMPCEFKLLAAAG